MIQNRQWQSLQSRRLLSRLHMMYRIRNDLVDINGNQHLTQTSTTTRSQSSRFQLRRCNTDTYLQSFFLRIAKDMNLLPTDPADFLSLDSFKSALGTLLHWPSSAVFIAPHCTYFALNVVAVPTAPLCVLLVVSLSLTVDVSLTEEEEEELKHLYELDLWPFCDT